MKWWGEGKLSPIHDSWSGDMSNSEQGSPSWGVRMAGNPEFIPGEGVRFAISLSNLSKFCFGVWSGVKIVIKRQIASRVILELFISFCASIHFHVKRKVNFNQNIACWSGIFCV